MSNCPSCGAGDVGEREVGELTVLICGDCGHGWLRDLAPDNDHFESDVYQRWRDTSRDSMRAIGVRNAGDLTRVTGRVPSSAVEIGCATGETIGRLAALGAKCWAVDMSAAAITAARANYPDVRFATGMMPAPGEAVEVAVMIHVIEHVPDPVETLRTVRKLVADQGYLYLRFPNYGGIAAKVLRGAWPDYMPDHLHYFTKRSIHEALHRSGWDELSVWTTARAWPWLGGVKRIVQRGRPAATAAAHGPPPSPRRMRILAIADKVAAPVLWAEARTGMGNELVVVARAV